MSAASSPLRIWLPALSHLAPASPLRGLVQRGDRIESGASGYLAVLEQTFPATPAGLPAAALIRQWLAGDADEHLWLCADPAWVQPEMNGARLLATGQLGLDEATAQALAEPLREVFREQGMQLELSAPDRWQVRLPADMVLPPFAAPEQALGADLFEHLPQGPEGRRWRILLNEVQVLLHQHPINAERRQLGLPPINSLWLWGGGRLPASVSSTVAGVLSDDVLLQALAHRAGVGHASRSEAAGKLRPGWLLDLQDLPMPTIESRFAERLLMLAAKQPLQLAFASGERYRCKPWHRWRFWRGGAKA